MNKLNLSKDKIIPILFIITLAISYVDDLFTGYQEKYIFLMIWILYAGFVFLKERKFDKKLIEISIILLLPKCIIWIHSLLLYIFNISNPNYFSTNITVLIPTLGIIAVLYIFKENGFKYVCCAFILSFVILCGLKIYNYGLITCLESFYKNQLITGVVSEWSPFEVHDLTFAAGYFILFIIFDHKESIEKKYLRLVIIIVSFLLMYLGFKRIQFLAFICIMLYCLIKKFINTQYHERLMNFIYYLILVISIIYLILILSGLFFEILELTNIDTMGRVYYYEFIRDICNFNITFLGIGVNNVGKYLTDIYSYLGVAGVHNDILKMYAELGFILFFAWLFYYLVFIPRYLNNQFGLKVYELFLIFSIYNFVIYTTDNIENYYISSFLYLFIPVWYALFGNKNKNNNQSSISNLNETLLKDKHKILFVCNTHYQLIIAIQLLITKFNNNNVELLLTDCISNAEYLKKKLESLNIFKKIYLGKIKQYKFDGNKKMLIDYYFLKKIGDDLALVVKNAKDYDEYFFANCGEFSPRFGSSLQKYNPKIKISMFEDGISSYSYIYGKRIQELSNAKTIKNKIRKIFFNNVLSSIDNYYVFSPEFMIWENKQIRLIPNINKNLDELKNILNYVYDYDNLEDTYNEKVIFFEESYFQDGIETNDLEIVNNISDVYGKENILIKIHPRNKINRFENLGYKTNKNTDVPWEVIALNINLDNKILITMSSSSLINTFIFLHPNCEFIYDLRGINNQLSSRIEYTIDVIQLISENVEQIKVIRN